MAVSNTFAYYNTAPIATVKSFIVQAPHDDLQFANKGVEPFEFLKLENVLKVFNFGIDCKFVYLHTFKRQWNSTL
jgi:hypothetical protein